MSEAPQILLEHRLKTLKLPTVLREYDKVARQCAHEGLDHVAFLARVVELELIDRERRLIERRIKAAKFPTIKSLDSFQFKAIPSLNKTQVLELARCEWIERRENVIALGPSGTGKTHVAQGLGLAACQRGLSVRFVTAAALVHELMEARDERRLLRLQKQFTNHTLLIIDELGFVPLSKTGAELLFELVSQRYERAAVLITSNLPFDEWTETFGSERLTGALLDRLTHHVHILELNGESFRLNHTRRREFAEPLMHVSRADDELLVVVVIVDFEVPLLRRTAPVLLEHGSLAQSRELRDGILDRILPNVLDRHGSRPPITSQEARRGA